MKIVRYGDALVQPWKNGQGQSRRIAAAPAGYDGYGEALLWHVSIPEIARSTTFSALPGLDRQWLLLSGDGVELHSRAPKLGIDVRRRLTEPLDALAFSGDWETECTLLGQPTLGLSVITRHGKIGAKLRIVELSGSMSTLPIEKPASSHSVVVLAEGRAKVMAEGGQFSLAPLDSIVGSSTGAATYVLSRDGFARTRAVVVLIDTL